MSKLQNKIALVTGGSRGIGAAIAQKLAEQGADVIITYSKSADEAQKVVAAIQKAGRKAKAIQADARHPEKIPEIIAELKKEFGRLDILVNNAGIFEGGLIGDNHYEIFEKTMNVNVRSVYYTTDAAVKAMPDGARIINISSVLGERGMTAGLSAYNASKFAVTGLTRSWAHDLAPRKITVNAVQPGPIDTDMNPADGEMAKQMTQTIPLKRYGKPQDIANAVAFLASDEAEYITGATLNVDGGTNA
jgi:3-oxoacyl-[acyl-carrier protein] reductase